MQRKVFCVFIFVFSCYFSGNILAGIVLIFRWKNHLDPSLKKGDWEPHEDELILKTQAAIGNKWAQIARLLPGRSDNAVKNRYYSTLTRKMKEKNNKKEKKQKEKKTNLQESAPVVSPVDAFPAVLPNSGVVPLVEYHHSRPHLHEIEPIGGRLKLEKDDSPVVKQESSVKEEVTIKEEPNYFPPVNDGLNSIISPYPYFSSMDYFYEPFMAFPVHYYPNDNDLFEEDYFQTTHSQFPEPEPVNYLDEHSFTLADSTSLYFDLDSTSPIH
eukprot:TRINITY_DN2021_c0_g1_i1.p1 TRINITY_DN2021_c0_g1~~TRINITY_DN2021_c0_g1_i1.p1  ORF type:complete len:270 (+),score=50.38 TRINITY_DN2021_c0_g1_i1:596-1405(+)